jgi:hypothetical protein
LARGATHETFTPVNPPPRNRRRPQHPANRRRQRPSPAQAAARRHSRWLVHQLQRAGLWLRGLPERLRQAAAQPRNPADTATSSRLRPASEPLLRAWDAPSEDSSPQLTEPTAPATTPAVSGKPRPNPAVARSVERLSALGKQLSPRARELGRQIAPKAAALGRQIAPLARRGALATGNGLRAALRRLADLRPLLRLLGRGFAGIGILTVRILRGLFQVLRGLAEQATLGFQRHKALLLALLQRGAWWAALGLLLVGGQALLGAEGHVPFGPAALPLFGLGLGLCAVLLVVAAQRRLRWAAFALGLGHGGLLTLVWTVTTA